MVGKVDVQVVLRLRPVVAAGAHKVVGQLAMKWLVGLLWALSTIQKKKCRLDLYIRLHDPIFQRVLNYHH